MYLYICTYIHSWILLFVLPAKNLGILCCMLQREEALRMWNKREAEWEKERQARERLMNDVLAERQKQIDTKIELLEEKQVRMYVCMQL